MFEKSAFKITNLDEYCKMIQVDGYTFSIGYNFNGEIQITSTYDVKVRQPETNQGAVFLKFNKDVKKPNDEAVN